MPKLIKIEIEEQITDSFYNPVCGTVMGHRLSISSEDVGTYKKGGFFFDGMV